MLPAGTKFGRYIVVRALGKGGMGTVYLVRHEVLDAYFALKVLPTDVAMRNSQFIPRFLREAKLCCRIRHPNLVSVHDAGRDEASGLYYLVMDYAPGGNLREKLEAAGGRLDARVALGIIRSLASALTTASEFGLVHRDIKPENIMFGTKGEAKLADLGIAKSSDDSTLMTMENAVFGTPAYMSPEQACDSGKVDARADIYSLGIVFFEMLCGCRPYDGPSTMNVIAQLLSDEPVPDVRKFVPEIDERIAKVVAGMCEKKVERRIASAQALLEKLDAIVGCPIEGVHEKPSSLRNRRTCPSPPSPMLTVRWISPFPQKMLLRFRRPPSLPKKRIPSSRRRFPPRRRNPFRRKRPGGVRRRRPPFCRRAIRKCRLLLRSKSQTLRRSPSNPARLSCSAARMTMWPPPSPDWGPRPFARSKMPPASTGSLTRCAPPVPNASISSWRRMRRRAA